MVLIARIRRFQKAHLLRHSRSPGSGVLSRPGLKERFPLLRVDKYLVVKPEIVGPNFKEFTKLYNEIFGIGK